MLLQLGVIVETILIKPEFSKFSKIRDLIHPIRTHSFWTKQSFVILKSECKLCNWRILLWGCSAYACSQAWSQRSAGQLNLSSEQHLPVPSQIPCLRNLSGGKRAAVKFCHIFVRHDVFCVNSVKLLWDNNSYCLA